MFVIHHVIKYNIIVFRWYNTKHFTSTQYFLYFLRKHKHNKKNFQKLKRNNYPKITKNLKQKLLDVCKIEIKSKRNNKTKMLLPAIVLEDNARP